MTARIQLALGIDEEATDVKITRSKDGDTSVAVFIFDSPKCMSGENANNNEILGMYMIDEEGVIESRDVNVNFVNGKPQAVESIYIMKSSYDWDRFMRFMERYAKSNGLIFTKA